MKVYIGPHTKWIGPYQIAQKILFWRDKYEDDSVHKLGEWLATNRKGENSWLANLCQWIYDRKNRRIYVKVDGYDTWNADHTLALIIVPVLKMMLEQKHGAPRVDDDDVPEELRSTSAPELTEDEKNCGGTDENWFKRWEYVLGEMIWAFEQHANPDWEDQYYSGETDIYFEKIEGTDYSEMRNGHNHTFKVDHEGKMKHRERMDNGRRLFAKYYESLWS